MTKQDKEFIKQYLVTALWSSGDEFDDFCLLDIDYASIKRAVKDCLEFIKLCEENDYILSNGYETAGHDFWLTRAGHGAGFWDGDYTENGDELTLLCENFSEVNLMVYECPHDGVNKIEIW